MLQGKGNSDKLAFTHTLVNIPVKQLYNWDLHEGRVK